MFGRTFGECSAEQTAKFGDLFFTGARAARFPYPKPIPTTSFCGFVHNSRSVLREAAE